MKVNEARFNNWVNFKFKGVDYGNVMIDKNYFSHYENKDYKYTPIPLTEEWLLKFGFKEDWSSEGYSYFRKEGFDMLKDYGSQGIAIPKNKEGYINLYCGYYDNEIDFEYVHQLQNLYFALTGKELDYEKS